jgi:type III restriction enzyme
MPNSSWTTPNRLTQKVGYGVAPLRSTVVPFKAGAKPSIEHPKQYRVYALPERSALEIKFPRVERYVQNVRTRITLDPAAAGFELNHQRIPAEVQMKAGVPTNSGRPSIYGPGALERIGLDKFRAEHRAQQVAFAIATDLAREYVHSGRCQVPPHALFPQLLGIVTQYLREKVRVAGDADIRDLLLSPWYGWVIEKLRDGLRPDTGVGDAPELPV